MAIVYTSLQLHQLCQQTAKAFKHVTKAVYDDLNALGISYATVTHGRSTGGRKQCQVNKSIPVIVTSDRTALPTPSTCNNLALTVRRCGIGADIRNLVCVQTNKWNLPTLVNTNVRGELAGKLDEIKVIKDNYGVDVIAITETWCTSSIPDGRPPLAVGVQHLPEGQTRWPPTRRYRLLCARLNSN